MTRSQDPEADLLRAMIAACASKSLTRSKSCVDTEYLVGLAEGTLTPQERACVTEHVADCLYCSTMVAAAVRELSDTPNGDAPPNAQFDPSRERRRDGA